MISQHQNIKMSKQIKTKHNLEGRIGFFPTSDLFQPPVSILSPT